MITGHTMLKISSSEINVGSSDGPGKDDYSKISTQLESDYNGKLHGRRPLKRCLEGWQLMFQKKLYYLVTEWV